jgi:hypothetical protein
MVLTSCSARTITGEITSAPPPVRQTTDAEFSPTGEIEYRDKSLLGAHFVNFSITEFPIPDFGRGYGGAIAKLETYILVATASGSFIQVDLLNDKIVASNLPKLNMGEVEFGSSKRITDAETLPRVHDLVVNGTEVYVSYDRYDPSVDGVRFVISRIIGIGTWVDIYVSPVLESSIFPLGSGGAMTLNPSLDSLFFSVGDFSLDEARGLDSDFAAQSDTLPWGHILKMDLDTLDIQLFSKGHRNPLGLLFVDDYLLSSEMGPRGGDEINLIESGKNFGWPYESFGTRYDSLIRYESPVNTNNLDLFTEPIWTFLDSVAPTQMIQSSFFGLSSNNVLMGSLVGESLFSFRYLEGRIQFMEQILVNSRVRDLMEFGNLILLLTDTGTMKVIAAV